MERRRTRPYPTDYSTASGILFDRRRHSLQIHDDLLLGFTSEGVAVWFDRLRLVQFHADGRTLTVRCGSAAAPVMRITVHYVNQFLPPPYAATLEGRRALLRYPDGELRTGNEHVLLLPSPRDNG